MSNRLPDFIEPRRLIEQGKTLTGTINLQRFSRLLSALASDQGDVQVQLHFGRDEQGYRCITGRIETCVDVVCQRCLETMPLPMHAEVCLGVVSGELEAEKLPRRYEPLLISAEPMFLADIVEDVLILELPFAPRHDTKACHDQGSGQEQVQHGTGVRAKEETGRKENPFAILQTLKDNKSTPSE